MRVSMMMSLVLGAGLCGVLCAVACGESTQAPALTPAGTLPQETQPGASAAATEPTVTTTPSETAAASARPTPSSATSPEPVKTPQPTSSAAAAPRASGDAAAAADRGTSDYQTIIQANRDRFRDCYDKSLAVHPGIAGKVTLKFLLDPTGKIKEAGIEKAVSDITEPDLEACMVKVLQSLAFPPSKRGMESTVHYPFNFHPRGRQAQPAQQPPQNKR